MSGKIQPTHLSRRALVYVRQSTATQVFEHEESTRRQYALADRAVSLGWPAHAVEVIDEDQGKSGASAAGRGGFARLVDAVVCGQAGALLAIEVSRLARNSHDWQRLLSLCAVAEVAVIDEQTIYDPAEPDDKLLLDLKGTMSEAELHWLGLRMTGARRSKARRGELRIAGPTGYVWREDGLAMDPDEAVQRAVRLVLERFAVEPSLWATVRWARRTGVMVPTRRDFANGTSEVTWKPLGLSRLHDMLHNPVYAGAYVYGRRPSRKVIVNGEIRRVSRVDRAPERWAVCLHGAHPAYIEWETFVKNGQKLRNNRTLLAHAAQGAARDGAGLLAGLGICGRCGRKMWITYGGAGKGRHYYSCAGERDRGQVGCWSVSGAALDAAVEELFLATMVPSEIDLSLAVERQVDGQSDALEKQWRARADQAGYEARRAERRYKAVDPDNRVVARTLEREWEDRLTELDEVERQQALARREKRLELTEEDRLRIRALARDLPAVWRASTTSPADRKAMLRLVVSAVSLTPVEVPERMTHLQVQWQGGAVSEMDVPRPSRLCATKTPAAAIERIRQLAAEGLRDGPIAEQLNTERLPTGQGRRWNVWAVRWVRTRSRIERTAPDAPRRLSLPGRHADGRYSIAGLAYRYCVSIHVVRGWIKRGIVTGHREAYGPYSGVWWIDLDERSQVRLAAIAAVPKAKASGRRGNESGEVVL